MTPTRRRVLVVLSGAMISILILAAPAGADGDPHPDRPLASGQTTPGGGAVEVATPGGGSAAPAGGASSASRCWTQPMAEPGPQYADTLNGGRPSADGYWSMQFCDGRSVGYVWTAGADPAVPAIELARQAANEVVVPNCHVRVAPPPDKLVVRFPTWLWLEGCTWAPSSATASVPLLSATVTATPTEVVWDMGDGTRIACEGPGVPWRTDAPPEAQSTYCSYSYRRSSSGEPQRAYTLTATVRWALSWSATNGEGGVLSPVLPSSTAAVRVGEVQTIVER